MDCLFRAGYYRARISTISDFDKIIGGMAWALQAFSYDINIDVFYADTLDLGQKIALTERIVMVLLAVKCPYRIEPHQIVGLDHDSLFPVIVWLIKRSEEIHREHEAFNRLLALRHYQRVAGAMSNRADWCHVVRLQLEPTGPQSAAAGQDALSRATAADPTLERIRETYKDHEQVSFVNLASLIRAARSAASAGTDDTEQSARLLDEDCHGLDRSRDSQLDRFEGETTNCFTDDDAQTTISNEADPHDTAQRIDRIRLDEAGSGPGPTLSPEEVELHRKLDLELLATNQKILNLLKKLDTMPSHLEVRQYQTRYVELHQQLIEKNKSVKRLFDLHNNLDVARHYLEKELSLLESISDNLDRAGDSDRNRDSFLRQMNDIAVKILSIRDDMAAKLVSLRNKCNSLTNHYDELLGQLTAADGKSTLRDK